MAACRGPGLNVEEMNYESPRECGRNTAEVRVFGAGGCPVTDCVSGETGERKGGGAGRETEGRRDGEGRERWRAEAGLGRKSREELGGPWGQRERMSLPPAKGTRAGGYCSVPLVQKPSAQPFPRTFP